MSGILLFVVLSISIPGGTIAASAQSKQQNKQPKGALKASATLTGCLDEQDGQYLLLDDRTMKPLADLDPNGIPAEALFAKHLGHKVTVRGSSTTGAARPLFKVREIETISEMCATATPQ
jgi:hypothetical protein